VTLTTADITGAGGALLAGPIFTGIPAAPTAAPGVSTTQLATTAFVAAAITAAPKVTSFNTRTGAVTLTLADITGAGGAPLASPTFTGTVTAPALISGGITSNGNISANNAITGASLTVNTASVSGIGINYSQFDTNSWGFGYDGIGLIAYANGTSHGYTVLSYANQYGATPLQDIVFNGGTAVTYARYNGGVVSWPVTVSDRKLKRNIKETSKDALATIAALPVHQFDLTMPFPDATAQHWDFGLIADEIEAQLPAAFVPSPDKDSYQSLRDLPLIALLVKAVQQLTERVAALETIRRTA
jgi:hypothetical protein